MFISINSCKCCNACMTQKGSRQCFPRGVICCCGSCRSVVSFEIGNVFLRGAGAVSLVCVCFICGGVCWGLWLSLWCDVMCGYRVMLGIWCGVWVLCGAAGSVPWYVRLVYMWCGVYVWCGGFCAVSGVVWCGMWVLCVCAEALDRTRKREAVGVPTTRLPLTAYREVNGP